MKKALNHPSASNLVKKEDWNRAIEALEEQLKSLPAPENQAHAAQLLCDATLAGSPYESLRFNEVLDWWDQCLEDFSQGKHLIAPKMPPEKLNQMRSELKALQNSFALIDKADEQSIDQLLHQADKALEKNGSRFRIPIVYQSQRSGKEEALIAEFTKEKDTLFVRLLNRGEGMRQHPLLEIRDSKRLYSYCTEKMKLRDQNLFCKKKGFLSSERIPTELGQAWIKQLKGFQCAKTCPEAIYAVFADVLAEVVKENLKPDMASSQERSATSAHHLPRILFRHDKLGEHKALKRLNFAVKIRALFQVLQNCRARSTVDYALLREEIAEIHAAAEKLARNKTISNEDLLRCHALTETLEDELAPPAEKKSISTDCSKAVKSWRFTAPKPRNLHPHSNWDNNKKPKAKEVISQPGELQPKPKDLLTRLKNLAENFEEQHIAEMHALLSEVPLPKINEADPYWDTIDPAERAELLETLRKLLQNYGHEIRNAQETELPRAILSVTNAYCFADHLARSLEGDPLKLKDFGLIFPENDERFFFHRREQIERWRALQNYFHQRNAGTEHQIFGYHRGKRPWGILGLTHNKGFYHASEQHLLYLEQFNSEPKRPLTQLIARRYLCGNEVHDGLQMPASYDDLHYFAITLTRLWKVSTHNTQEDLGNILLCDQIPVLLHYYDEKKNKDYYELIYRNAKSLPTELKPLVENRQRSFEAPVTVQTRQTPAYSQKAEAVFFPEKLRTENQILHANAALDTLPQAAVHALQLIMLQNVYRLRLSQLMDFCSHFPLACRHPDVRVLIEHVLLQEGALYHEFRQDGGQQLENQVHDFLRAQRERTAASENGFEDHLHWQRLTLDIEQLAPEKHSHVEELLTELEDSTRTLKLDDKKKAALALHRAYLYSLHPDKPAPELLRYWMEARTLRRQLNKSSTHWMEGEIQRQIELQGEVFKNAIPKALEHLSTFLPECGEWTNNEGIYECRRGPDRIEVDPLEGCIFCNDVPLGSPPDREPQSLADSARTLLGLKRSPPLKQGADKIWRLASDPSLRFERRAPYTERALGAQNGALGVERYEALHFYQLEDLWLLPSSIQERGKTFWSTLDASSIRVLIEEADGLQLIIHDAKGFWSGNKITSYTYLTPQKIAIINKV